MIRWKYYYFLSIYFEEEGSKEKELHGGQNIRTTLITRLEYVSELLYYPMTYKTEMSNDMFSVISRSTQLVFDINIIYLCEISPTM